MITLDDLMHAACRQYSYGVYAVTTPFVLDGWEYATDLAVCIRRRTDARDSKPGAGERFPNVQALNWNVEGEVARPIDFGALPPRKQIGPNDDPDDDESPRLPVEVHLHRFNQDYLQALTLAGGVIHQPQIVSARKRHWGIAIVGPGWTALCMPSEPNMLSSGPVRHYSAVLPLRRLIRRHLESQTAKGATR
jgi:hypothetical protein